MHLHDTFKPKVHVRANIKRKRKNAVFWENPFVPFSYCPYVQVFLKLEFVLIFYFQQLCLCLAAACKDPSLHHWKCMFILFCCSRMQGSLTPACWIGLIFPSLHLVRFIKEVCSLWTYSSLSVPCPLSHSPPTHSLEALTVQICHGLYCNLVKWQNWDSLLLLFNDLLLIFQH